MATSITFTHWVLALSFLAFQFQVFAQNNQASQTSPPIFDRHIENVITVSLDGIPQTRQVQLLRVRSPLGKYELLSLNDVQLEIEMTPEQRQEISVVITSAENMQEELGMNMPRSDNVSGAIRTFQETETECANKIERILLAHQLARLTEIKNRFEIRRLGFVAFIDQLSANSQLNWRLSTSERERISSVSKEMLDMIDSEMSEHHDQFMNRMRDTLGNKTADTVQQISGPILNDFRFVDLLVFELNEPSSKETLQDLNNRKTEEILTLIAKPAVFHIDLNGNFNRLELMRGKLPLDCEVSRLAVALGQDLEFGELGKQLGVSESQRAEFRQLNLENESARTRFLYSITNDPSADLLLNLINIQSAEDYMVRQTISDVCRILNVEQKQLLKNWLKAIFLLQDNFIGRLFEGNADSIITIGNENKHVAKQIVRHFSMKTKELAGKLENDTLERLVKSLEISKQQDIRHILGENLTFSAANMILLRTALERHLNH